MKEAINIGIHSGRLVDPIRLRVSDVTIEDIAYHLSRISAYNGGTKGNLYNNAERGLIMSYAADQDDAMMCMAALMSKATKYVLGDLSRPLKLAIPSYREMEATVAMNIGETLCYNPTHRFKEVQVLSEGLRRKEIKQLTNYPKSAWEDLPSIKLPPFRRIGWQKSKNEFINRFYDLSKTIAEKV